MLRGVRRLTIAGVCLSASVMVSAMTADASIAHDTVVSEAPARFTPHAQDGGGVTDAAVHAFNQIGNTMYAGGEFRVVADAGRTTTYTRSHLFSFNASTGEVSGFAPQIDGPIFALESSGASLYVGGKFSSVDGVARRALVKIDTGTGQVDSRFNAGLSSGQVTEIRLVNGRLLVGGTFPGQLRALDPATGVDTGYIKAAITGRLANKDGLVNSGLTSVYKFAVTPNGSRLVGIGNFTHVDGQPRSRAFMLDLSASSSALSSWYYRPLQRACKAESMPSQLRDVDFSPDGSYFVMVATGWVPQAGGVGTDICDVAARFETAKLKLRRPTWTNYTGGDTLHSVAITGSAVYVQGHQRWLDNPSGVDNKGPGAVDRPGIGAIDPVTGKALPWNPTKDRGIGGKDLYVTSAGLWVGSDTSRYRLEYHDSIAFAPLR